MTEYLIINIIVSGWVLSVNRLMTIQAKYKFMLLIFAISSWGIPFGLASFQSNSTLFEHAQPVISSVKVPITNLISQTQTSNFSWQSLLMMLILLGFIRFLIDVIQLYKQHQLYIIKGQATAIKNVFCIKGLHNASVSGLFKPKIWIDESLYHSGWAGTIISHEQQHIKAGDTYWLLWITLFQRLFWFNPVMWLLTKQSRLAIELRCDAACQQHAQNEKYQTELAQILLKMNQQSSSTINHMSHSPKNNMIRIKQLSKETTMKKQNYLSFYTSAVLILSLSVNLLAKTTNEQPMPSVDEVFLEIAFAIKNNSDNEPLVEENFALLAKNGESVSAKINSYLFHIKPNVITEGEHETQIFSEIILEESLNKHEVRTLTSHSILSDNKKQATTITEDENSNLKIVLGLTATTINK